jgi:hypothetical protein
MPKYGRPSVASRGDVAHGVPVSGIMPAVRLAWRATSRRRNVVTTRSPSRERRGSREQQRGEAESNRVVRTPADQCLTADRGARAMSSWTRRPRGRCPIHRPRNANRSDAIPNRLRTAAQTSITIVAPAPIRTLRRAGCAARDSSRQPKNRRPSPRSELRSRRCDLQSERLLQDHRRQVGNWQRIA